MFSEHGYVVFRNTPTLHILAISTKYMNICEVELMIWNTAFPCSGTIEWLDIVKDVGKRMGGRLVFLGVSRS